MVTEIWWKISRNGIIFWDEGYWRGIRGVKKGIRRRKGVEGEEGEGMEDGEWIEVDYVMKRSGSIIFTRGNENDAPYVDFWNFRESIEVFYISNL